MDISEILRMAWPLLVIELVLLAYAWYDLAVHRKTKTLSVPVWAVICLINIIGPIAYFLYGRTEE